MLAHSFLFGKEEEAHLVEAMVHASLRSDHRRGEWFSVTPEAAHAAIMQAAGQYGFPILADGEGHRKNNGQGSR